MKKIKEIILKNNTSKDSPVIKEKNSVSYRLNNQLFSDYEPSQKIVKNIFYNYITIPPISKDTKKIIRKMNSLTNEELKILLSKTLNSYFKEFVKQSRISKASIETYYNELINGMHTQYQDFKADQKKEFTKYVSKIQNRLDAIEKAFNDQQEKITEIKNSLQKNEKAIREERIATLEDKRKELDLVQQFIEDRDKQIEKNLKPLALINAETQAISNDVQNLITEREELISELNQRSLDLANRIDAEYTKKEKQKATIEIEKISAYIFIRNSLIFLNRIIRDVRIEIGLRKIQNRWDQILDNFAEVREQSQKMMNELKFFDSIIDIESKIDAIRDIEIKTRIVDLETTEEVGG